MVVRLFADETGCAIYEEASGGGDPLNPTSLMNRPFLNPMSWVDNILFHSEFNYYGIAAYSLGTTIAHAAVAGQVNARPYSPVSFNGRSVVTTHTLLTHNLGYVPLFFVAQNGQMIPHGTPLQTMGAGGRLVSPYATTTQIRLRDLAITTDQTLPAINATYQIMVFRNIAKDPALPMLDLLAGAAVFGQGKFRQSQAHLRAQGAGDTPFSIALGRTAAIRNGALRVRTPGGGFIDVGSFTGSIGSPGYINVAAGI